MRRRLDEKVRELFPSVAAEAEIMSGRIFVNGVRRDKCGDTVKDGDVIEYRGKPHPYVSRGGLKLEGAIAAFGLNLDGVNALDIGSSTGGFTDCMLQSGAKRVTCVDVGVELAYKLRTDERVKVMEKTNIRYCNRDTFNELFDFVTSDVSFISLKHVLPVIDDVLTPDGTAVCLIKPQFEAKREEVGKGGIVTDPEVHIGVIRRVLEFKPEELKLNALVVSPIKGTKGNTEYLAKFTRYGTDITVLTAEETVRSAAENIRGKAAELQSPKTEV